MGNTQDAPTFSMLEETKRLGLPEPDSYIYDNDFERDTLLALNIIRHEPPRFWGQVERVKSK